MSLTLFGGDVMLWFMGLAVAEEPNSSQGIESDEVIVWAKPFSRFDETRWVVRSLSLIHI